MVNLGLVYFYNEPNEDYVAFCFSEKYGFQKIKSIIELDKNMIWYSNLKKSKKSYIKNFNYFNVNFEDLMYFLNIKEQKIEQKIDYIYKILNNAYLKILKHYEVDLKNKTLSQGLFEKIEVKKDFYDLANINDFIEERKDINVLSKNITKNKKVVLSCLDYFEIRDICKKYFPIGGWLKSDSLKYEREKNKKKALKIRVKNSKKWISRVLPKYYFKDKVWIIDEEYEFLSSIGCELEIFDIYYSENIFYLKNIESKKLFRIRNQENNISNYIAASVYLSSFKNKNKIIEAWLNQYEKIKAMKISFIMASMDINVLAYGKNKIIVELDNNEEKVFSICNKLNLNYPTFLFDKS